MVIAHPTAYICYIELHYISQLVHTVALVNIAGPILLCGPGVSFPERPINLRDKIYILLT